MGADSIDHLALMAEHKISPCFWSDRVSINGTDIEVPFNGAPGMVQVRIESVDKDVKHDGFPDVLSALRYAIELAVLQIMTCTD